MFRILEAERQSTLPFQFIFVRLLSILLLLSYITVLALSSPMEPKDECLECSLAKIENFRHAGGMKSVYRCASTDVLADLLPSKDRNFTKWASSDRMVFEKAGLILDLRSPVERKENKARKWASSAGVHIMDAGHSSALPSEKDRFLVRVNVLSPSKFMAYIEEFWMDAKEKRKAAFFKKVNDKKLLHALRIEKLNQRGLYGLNQVILEPGRAELCKALKIITVHLEGHPNDVVVIHCVQGKDRTGMLVMLLQSILGFPDKIIIEDYFQSNGMLGLSAAAATAQSSPPPGKMDRNAFAGANREAMIQTLLFLRRKYGSVSPGYTDYIGFNESWRQRLLQVVQPAPDFKRSSSL